MIELIRSDVRQQLCLDSEITLELSASIETPTTHVLP